MHPILQNSYNSSAFASLDKQVRLEELHGGQAWGFDMSEGLLRFGEDESVGYKIQILGTEDLANEEWMWGWANEASGIPEHLLAAGQTLKMLGEKHDIEELITPRFANSPINGETLAMLGLGICRANAYYPCPYNEGKGVLLC